MKVAMKEFAWGNMVALMLNIASKENYILLLCAGVIYNLTN